MSIQKILLQFEPRAENLLPALKKIQKDSGYVCKSDCEEAAKYFSLSTARVYSAASFFDLLKTGKEAKKTIRVCSGGPCLGGKSIEIVHQIELLLKIELGNDANPKYKLEFMSCAGLCDQGPVVEIEGQIFEKVRPEMVDDLIRNYI